MPKIKEETPKKEEHIVEPPKKDEHKPKPPKEPHMPEKKKDLLNNINNACNLKSQLDVSNEQLLDLVEELFSGKSLMELVIKAEPIIKVRKELKENFNTVKRSMIEDGDENEN